MGRVGGYPRVFGYLGDPGHEYTKLEVEYTKLVKCLEFKACFACVVGRYVFLMGYG